MDPLVEEVELLHANPNYAYVRFSSGREDTVSLKDLAPPATALPDLHQQPSVLEQEQSIPYVPEIAPLPSAADPELQRSVPEIAPLTPATDPELRRSVRDIHQPDRLIYSKKGGD
jgi:hypothetical protein